MSHTSVFDLIGSFGPMHLPWSPQILFIGVFHFLLLHIRLLFDEACSFVFRASEYILGWKTSEIPVITSV